MKMQETDRYGNPIKEITLDEVIEDLLQLPPDMVAAYCAALIILHQNHLWKETFEILLNGAEQ